LFSQDDLRTRQELVAQGVFRAGLRIAGELERRQVALDLKATGVEAPWRVDHAVTQRSAAKSRSDRFWSCAIGTIDVQRDV